MEIANPDTHDSADELNELFIKMEEILKNQGRIYTHCSAGIHRTGMISFAFLRFLGNTITESKNKLKQLRITTGNEVGDHRIEWANNIYDEIKKRSK